MYNANQSEKIRNDNVCKITNYVIFLLEQLFLFLGVNISHFRYTDVFKSPHPDGSVSTKS